MKKVVIALFVLMANFVFCQDKLLFDIRKIAKEGDLKTAEKKVDSLLTIKKHQNINGELLLEKAKILRIKGKNKAFLKFFTKLIKIAEQKNDKVLEANAYYQKYLLLNDKGAENLAALAKYISVAKESNDGKLLFSVYLKLTSIAIKAGNAQKAKTSLKKAHKYYTNWQKTDSIYPNINFNLARIYDLEEKYDSVFITLKKTLSQYKYHKRNRALTQIYYVLGANEQTRNNYNDAYKYLLLAHNWAVKIDNKRFIEISYTKIFNLLLATHTHEKNELFKKLLIFFKANSLKEATLNFEKKYNRLKRLSPKQMALNDLSLAFEKTNNLKKALSYKNKWANFSLKRVREEQLNTEGFVNLELEISKLKKDKKTLKVENELNFTQKIILILSFIILLILSLFIWSQQRLKIKNEQVSKLSVEKDFLKATKERIDLEKTLKQKELELNSFIRDMIEKNSQIEILQNKLKQTNVINENELTQELKSKQFSASKNWIEFMFKFNQLHPKFTKSLKDKIPNLSPTETKLSILSFLNLSSKEIGSILSISASSVNQGKYRLKKKIGLEKSIRLSDFFQNNIIF